MLSRRTFLQMLIPGGVALAWTRRRDRLATFDVTDPQFGADPTGRRDSTTAVAAAAAALQLAGGGTLYFPPGLYRVLSPAAKRGTPTRAVAAFNGLSGVTVLGEDATLSVDWEFELNQFVNVFEFTDCLGIRVSGLEGTVPAYYRYGIAEDTRGPRFVRLLGACRDVEVDARLTRFGWGVSCVAAGLADNEPRTIGLNVRLDLKQCRYGLACKFSGDDVVADIQSDQIGRSYFVYGVRNHDVVIRSRNNNRADCLLAGYRGRGLENIKVSYTNVGSTSARRAAAGVAMAAHWEGGAHERGCEFRDIDIHYHVEYPEKGFPGHALHVQKYDRDGAYDRDDRGHRFENITISGYVRGSAGGGLPMKWDGDWGEGEIYRNWTLRDLRFEGTSSAYVNLTPLKEGGLLQNVISDNHIYLSGNPHVPIRVVSCRARSLCRSRDDRSRIEYVDSVITSPVNQSRANKTFTRTRVGAG